MRDTKIIVYGATVVAFTLFVSLLLFSCSHQPLYPSPPRTGSDVAIDIATLQPGVPQFFTYHYRGRHVIFFVLKIDGKVLSFLDACMSCYPRKLGFRYEDGYVVCRACDVQYPVTKLETGIGGCFPIRIAGTVKEGRYRIPIATLERMANRF